MRERLGSAAETLCEWTTHWWGDCLFVRSDRLRDFLKWAYRL